MARLTLEGKRDVTRVPARLAFVDLKPGQSHKPIADTAIKGTRGTHGDAGWTLVECVTAERAARFVADYPEAAMPCWRRFEVKS